MLAQKNNTFFLFAFACVPGSSMASGSCRKASLPWKDETWNGRCLPIMKLDVMMEKVWNLLKSIEIYWNIIESNNWDIAFLLHFATAKYCFSHSKLRPPQIHLQLLSLWPLMLPNPVDPLGHRHPHQKDLTATGKNWGNALPFTESIRKYQKVSESDIILLHPSVYKMVSWSSTNYPRRV